MPYNPDIHHRRSIRLPAYDYSQPGAYFVTICAHQRELLFQDETLKQIVEETWKALPQRFPSISPDEFIILPNHLHFIVWLNAAGAPLAGAHNAPSGLTVGAPLAGALDGGSASIDVGAPLAGAPAAVAPSVRARASPAPTLATVVGAFKSIVSSRWLKWITANSTDRAALVWQRNYYERVIRDEDELAHIRQYILDNPAKWADDENNPAKWQVGST